MLKTTINLPLTLNGLLKELVFRISPKAMMVIMAMVIFLVEALVMVILSEIPPLEKELEALLDSTILLLLLTPFYMYIYRPFWAERQKQARQIRFLSQELLTATEEESKRIAHEIHDQCGQTLTALQFGIQALKKMIATRDPSSLSQAESLEQIAGILSNELRSLTTRLRPPILDEAGLISAIDWQVQTFRKNFPDITITDQLLRKSDLNLRLSSTTEDAIYRICQEALTNIARHASATEVQLAMVRSNKTIELKIEDNGRGFDLDRCLEQTDGACGIGLLGMRERALMVGGRFQIVTKAGEGTAILAVFPTEWS